MQKNDRVVNLINLPPQIKVTHKTVFPKSEFVPDYKFLKDYFANQGLIEKKDAKIIVQLAKNIFEKEQNVVKVNEPLNVIGDIHGQYYDLIKLMQMSGVIEKESSL